MFCRRAVTAKVSGQAERGATLSLATGEVAARGALMRGRLWPVALVAAGFSFFATPAIADELSAADAVRRDATTFETSMRVRSVWTEIAFRGDRPKAWDDIVSPEFRASLRVLAGLFEAKLEIGALADRFAHFETVDTNSLRGELQVGVNTGAWSYLVEWKPRDVFKEGFSNFLVGLDTYDARVRHRFVADVFAGLPPGLFQATVAAGYTASTPSLFERNFAEFEVEMVQGFNHGLALIIAPKLELSDYPAFPGPVRRDDAVFSLRLIPTYNFSSGIALSLEGQATIAFSTRDTKTGEAWALTPILRLQKAF